MPIFMDRHFIEGATKSAIAHAHARDLEVQKEHGVQFLTYWFDESRHTAFCLIDAPNKDAIQRVHDEAHGDIPHEIIEVDPSVVQAFLGRVSDPAAIDTAKEAPDDSPFRAIMFTDLVGSTRMTVRFGDAKALHLLHISNALTRNALRDFGGSEVKHTGDGIMASFASVPRAVECGMTIQRELHAHNTRRPEEALHLRIGLSAGEPVEEHGDLFGKAVQLAARLCAHADPGQILIAQAVRDECPDGTAPVSDRGEITPKGFDQPVPVYAVEWK